MSFVARPSQSCNVEQLEPYMSELIGTVKRSLIDPEEEVRQEAAQVFAALHAVVGPQIVEEVVEPLLAEVQTNENALDGLRQMIGSKGSFILPLVRTLLLCIVPPPTYSFSLSSILSAVMTMTTTAVDGIKYVDYHS